MRRLVFDIETNGLIPELDRVHCVVAKDIDTEERWSFRPDDVEEGLDLLLRADQLWGHNIIGFDIPAIQKVYPDWQPEAELRDTLVISRLIWPDMKARDFALHQRTKRKHGASPFPGTCIGRHNLESWGYRLGLKKGEFGKATDWAEFSEEMLAYCEQDVEVNHKLVQAICKRKYSQYAIEIEQVFRWIIDRQEEHGFCFNEDAAAKLLAELSQHRNDLEQRMHEVFPPRYEEMRTPAYYLYRGDKFGTKKAAEQEARRRAKAEGVTIKSEKSRIETGPPAKREIPFNPGSRHQIAERLIEKYSWKPKSYTGDGVPEVTETILKQLPYDEAGVLAEFLMVQKRLGQLAEGKNAWLKLVESDGRIHGRVNTNGAVTGRCTHSRPNVTQVPSVAKPWGKECRGLFGPPEGWVQVGCDASGLELRCLAHYMARWDGGEYVEVVTEGDVHTTNQKAAGFPTRNSSKPFTYGFLYGAGDEKLGSIKVKAYIDEDLPRPKGKLASIGKKLRQEFLSNLPALNRLLTAIQKAAKERGYLRGLDGRWIPVRHQHAALNTLLQGAGGLVMKVATIIWYEDMCLAGWTWGEDFALMAHVHDEIQFGCRPEIADEAGRMAVDAIRKTGEELRMRCPLDGEYEIGSTWAETH